MAQFCTSLGEMIYISEDIKRANEKLSRVCDRVDSVKHAINFKLASRSQIVSSMNRIMSDMEDQRTALWSMGSGLEQAVSRYRSTEDDLIQVSNSKITPIKIADTDVPKWNQQGKEADNPLLDLCVGIAGEGLDEALQVKWAGPLMDLISNAVDNYKEWQGGEISETRAIEETVSETAVNIVLGTVVASLLGVVGAPAMAAGFASVAILWVADVVFKKFSGGKGLTETISDGFLNGLEKFNKGIEELSKSVGKAAKRVGGFISTLWENSCFA